MADELDVALGVLNRLRQAIQGRPLQDRSIDIVEDNTQKVAMAIRTLAGVEILVGIPAETNARPGSSIGNAAIGHIHETGSPLNNIPARPWLRPGVTGSQSEWLPHIAAANQAMLDFKPGAMMAEFETAGQIAANAAQMKIQEGIPPPLKHPRYRKGRPPQRPNEATPLYDTGNLLRAITYVVTVKKR
jgi:hypothetical protein